MKAVYTILFFADALLLTVLAFLFLRFRDQNDPAGLLVLTCAGIICCIAGLLFILGRYFKAGSHQP